MDAQITLDLHSLRARSARLGKLIGKSGYAICLLLALICIIAGALAVYKEIHAGYSLLGLAGLFLLPALWWKFGLSKVPSNANDLNGRISHEVLARLNPANSYSPRSLFSALQNHWQAIFITNHLYIHPDDLTSLISDNSAELAAVWGSATAFADNAGSQTVELGHVAGAILLNSESVDKYLTSLKLSSDDLENVIGWLSRGLADMNRPRDNFGGIGRDWANGYTQQLNHFGHNVTESIEATGGGHFGALANGQEVQAMKNAIAQGAGDIALIGQAGIGKTSHVYALAQNILTKSTDKRTSHQQIFALDASAIISAAGRPGELESILNNLLGEAYHAGNIMLFFDNAELFLNSGPGSFNATQILLPILQNRAIPMIFALNPHDWENLKATNQGFASLLTPVVLVEQPEKEILKILCDTATGFESRHRLLISYPAIKEAYSLSGRYNSDMAYPGRAINLLEQSLTHANENVVTAESVQAAIEQTTGVKTSGATAIEAEQLLNLEDEIHKRMINQSKAVSVVAAALRRARAGVGSKNRPIGSFLFLGPTGVGKTELAKSVATTYFGDEHNMVRLDMSEYQQESDVARILSDGHEESSSLTLKIRQQPFSVVLLDEIEKAHPNILNLLLQLLDEGQLTDVGGRAVSFKDAIIIATSNAGADKIREKIAAGEDLESFQEELTDELIGSGQFKPELLNRFDEIVLFRPLKPDELAEVVKLMLAGINQTLAEQKISVELTDAAIMKIVEVGNDPRLGARPMRRALQRAVEDTVAEKILKHEANPGDHLTLDVGDLKLN